MVNLTHLYTMFSAGKNLKLVKKMLAAINNFIPISIEIFTKKNSFGILVSWNYIIVVLKNLKSQKKHNTHLEK